MRFRVPLSSLLVAAAGFATAAHANAVSTVWADSASNGSPILYEFDLSTGAELDKITAPHGDNGRGIVQVGDILYYTSAYTNAVYAYNFVTNTDLGTAFTVAGSTGLSTIAYDGTNFWIGDYSGTNHAYEYTPTGTLLSTVSLSNCTGFCDGLEYGQDVASINGGGGFLISNRSDEPSTGVYDIYNLNGTLLQSAFITSPYRSTGIAFDGTDFYIDHGGDSGAQTIGVYDTSGAFVRTITLGLGSSDFYVGEDLSVNYAAVLTPPTVPEPGAMLLFGAGLLGLSVVLRRRSRA